MKKGFMKKAVGAAVSLTLTGALLAGCGNSSSSSSESDGGQTSSGSASSSSAESGGEKYKIALSNSYMGNDWRQLMIKTAQIVAEKDPYADKVQLDVVNCENTAEAQSASIDALVEE